MNTGSPRVFLILPTYNRSTNVARFLLYLKLQEFKNFFLILVDDGSTDGTAQMTKVNFGERVTVITGKGSWWWGGSLHQAYLYLKKSVACRPQDLVLIMNDDTHFDPAFVGTGAQALLKSGPKTLLMAINCDSKTGEARDRGVRFEWGKRQFYPVDDIALVNCFATRGLMLYLSDFIGLRGFWPRLLPHYFSDYEFSIRAFRRGFRPLIDERFRVRVDFEQTAPFVFDFEGKSAVKRLAFLFSKRCKQNPLYRTNFILLACPMRYWPRQLFSVWARSVLMVYLLIRGKKW